jgi:hypothetical protein
VRYLRNLPAGLLVQVWLRPQGARGRHRPLELDAEAIDAYLMLGSVPARRHRRVIAQLAYTKEWGRAMQIVPIPTPTVLEPHRIAG